MYRRIKVILVMLAALLAVSGCSLLDEATPVGKTTEKTPEERSTDVDEATIPEATEGSTQNTVKNLNFNLYFPDSGNEAVIKENREVEVSDGAIIKAAVQALLGGPASRDLRNPFPAGTNLLGVNLKDRVAIVDFSKEFNQAGDVAGIVLRVSIVNTLTDIDGIEKVRILVDGSPLIGPSGLPFEDMEKVQLDADGKPMSNQ